MGDLEKEAKTKIDKELFENEIWNEIGQFSICLFYLDEFRASKERIAPVYRGIVALLALLSALADIIEWPYYPTVFSVLTAISVVLPAFFGFIPEVDFFYKIDVLRVEVKKRLTQLEEYWVLGVEKVSYSKYKREKIASAEIETNLSALFGKVNEKGKLYQKARENSDLYLNKFYIES